MENRNMCWWNDGKEEDEVCRHNTGEQKDVMQTEC